MKTMFVVSEGNVNKHVGEEYDLIVEVENQPTTATIQKWASQIRDGILSLWNQEVGYNDPNRTAVNPKVSVSLDAASPYHAVLLNLQVIMKVEGGVEIELPYMTAEMKARVERDEIGDREAKELLKKLGKA